MGRDVGFLGGGRDDLRLECLKLHFLRVDGSLQDMYDFLQAILAPTRGPRRRRGYRGPKSDPGPRSNRQNTTPLPTVSRSTPTTTDTGHRPGAPDDRGSGLERTRQLAKGPQSRSRHLGPVLVLPTPPRFRTSDPRRDTRTERRTGDLTWGRRGTGSSGRTSGGNGRRAHTHRVQVPSSSRDSTTFCPSALKVFNCQHKPSLRHTKQPVGTPGCRVSDRGHPSHWHTRALRTSPAGGGDLPAGCHGRPRTSQDPVKLFGDKDLETFV